MIPTSINKGARLILIFALLASFLSFAKFQHCRSAGWGSPDVYIHMCYSDLSALYGAREINVDRWPYESPDNSVEYPVITGLIMWATGKVISDPNGYRAYFDINALLIALVFIFSAWLLWRIKPEFAALLSFSPAVIGSLYINWDIWAIAAALVAIYLFQKQRFDLSALALGISIATKFFPIVLLLPVILYFKTEITKTIRYIALTSIAWIAINLPIALTNFDGWSRFYKMNVERSSDLGSIWYALQLRDITFGNSTFLSVILVLLAALAIANIANQSKANTFETFSITSFLTVAAFVTISKVYSPQYIIWLTPLALIAMRRKEERSAFWIWQGGEALYHLAIWQYLASYTGAKFGLPEGLYALSIFIRVATLAWFARALIHSSRSADFSMSEGGDSLSALHQKARPI
ncbi:MAG: glycosyltransferase family 87 protein [Candidatus Nanopelagicaceae bacterium]